MEVLKGENKFFIGDDEETPIAELTYRHKDEDTIIADHTYVSEELRGQGVAGKLFKALVEFVREENIKVIPECSYIEAKMDRSARYDDIRA